MISVALPRNGSWAGARRPLIGLAVLTWLAVAALVGTLVLMTIQVAQAYGGQLPQTAPDALPAGVLRLVGWADRLVVVANCLWVGAVAWCVAVVSRAPAGRLTPRPSTRHGADRVGTAS